MKTPQLLIENVLSNVALTIVEGEGGKKKLIARGQFGVADLATENKRVYPAKLLKREFGRMSESMGRRALFGELDHPADGKTKLQRVSHLITNLELKGSEVIGEAEILPTPMGKILEALVQSGAAVGVSSRGYGSTEKDDDGNDVVGEDFRLLSYDFVADPAAKTAYPKVFAEEKAIVESDDATLLARVRQQDAQLAMLLESELPKVTAEFVTLTESAPVLDEAKKPKVYSEAEVAEMVADAKRAQAEHLKEEYAASLVESMALVREDLTESTRTEMLADPEVAGARRVVESLVSLVRPFIVPGTFEEQLKEVEARAKAAEVRVEELEASLRVEKSEKTEALELGRRAAIELRLRTLFEGYVNAPTLMDLMSDRIASAVTMEDVDRLAKRLCEQVGQKVTPAENADLVTLREKLVRTEERNTSLVSQNRELRGLLEVATPELEEFGSLKERVKGLEEQLTASRALVEERGELASTRKDALDRLSGEAKALRKIVESIPGGDTLTKMISEGKPQAEIDRALAESARERHDPEKLENVRVRVRRGIERDVSEDETGKPRGERTTAAPAPGPGPLSESVKLDQKEFDRLAGV